MNANAVYGHMYPLSKISAGARVTADQDDQPNGTKGRSRSIRDSNVKSKLLSCVGQALTLRIHPALGVRLIQLQERPD